jgi:hypothetical protein
VRKYLNFSIVLLPSNLRFSPFGKSGHLRFSPCGKQDDGARRERLRATANPQRKNEEESKRERKREEETTMKRTVEKTTVTNCAIKSAYVLRKEKDTKRKKGKRRLNVEVDFKSLSFFLCPFPFFLSQISSVNAYAHR